jgi:putative spermidine/putrescine transport system permease protein
MQPAAVSGKRQKLNSFLLVMPVLIVLVVFYFYPVLRLFVWSFFDPDFTLKHYYHIFEKPLYFKILLRTFKIAFLVTLVSLVLSYPVASFLAAAKGKKQLLMVCVVLPFWTSLLVRTYAWMVLLQSSGLVNRLLKSTGLIEKPLHLMYNSTGVVIGMVHVLIPFMILPIYSVLKGIDQDLKLAAYTLGANRVKTFLKITLPLSLPGVGAGILFVFVLSLGFFITPSLLGGPKVTMISTLIETQVNTLNRWGFGAAIALVLLLCVVAILGMFFRFINFEKIAGNT